MSKNNDAARDNAQNTGCEESRGSPDTEVSPEEAACPVAEEEAAKPAAAEENASPDELSVLSAEIKSLKDELAAEKDKYLRLLAEYDNYRKRSQKERENIFFDVQAETITRFLPVYDNLARALAQETADEAYRKGVEMIMAQFQEILEKFGVTEIEALGRKFDPELHNAVMHTEDETKGENEIVEEFQKGFMMGDRVIRYSMVKVAN
ncbi:MAG: nucleotide exchange factor GrpE [Oscillospiraceae bacterium]|jgi:molecular chaperone GrpE